MLVLSYRTCVGLASWRVEVKRRWPFVEDCRVFVKRYQALVDC